MSNKQLATAENEYQKNSDLKKSDVKLLQQWVESQPHLPPISEFKIILFLQSCFSSTQLAKNTIDVFFTLKTHCPEFFGDRAIDTKPKEFFNTCLFALLPQLTPDNYKVIYAKILDLDYTKFNFSDQVKILDMTLMLELRQHGTQKGLIIVFDMEQLPFAFMTRFSLMGMKKFLYYLQEGMPVRLMGFHFLNIVPFMDKFLALMKPFMKQTLMEMIHLHESIDTLKKFIPQECLPKDLGGAADSISQLHETMKNNLRQNQDFFIKEQQQLVDESKRPAKPEYVNSIFGVEGSFKKLDID